MMKRLSFTIGILFLLAVGISEAQTLTHSYTFEDLTPGDMANGTTIVNQATGLADATLYLVGTGTAALGSDFSLTLNGTNSSNGAYVDLPDNIIGDKSAVTFQTWVTPNSNLTYARVFDIGGAENASRFFFALDNNNSTDNMSYAQLEGAGGTANYKLENGTKYCLTVTETGNSLNYYVNGMLTSSVAISVPLSTRVGDTNFMGKSHWNDNYAAETIAQFDVYDAVMGPAQVKAQYLMGASGDQAIYNRDLTMAAAQNADALVASSEGFWSVTTAGKVTDLSGNNRNLTRQRTTSISTENSAGLQNALLSDGLTLQIGNRKTGENGYLNSTDASLCKFTGSATYSARINMETFKTSTTNLTFMEAMAGLSKTFAIGTTQGTDASGVLTLFAQGDASDLISYYLQSKDSGGYELTSTYNNENAYFALDANTWYDITGVFESIDADSGKLSLYAYDSVDGSLLAAASADVDYGQLSQNASELLIFETYGTNWGTQFGSLDYAGVWASALTADQIAGLSGQAVVPEPSSWALLIFGAAGLVWFKRRAIKR